MPMFSRANMNNHIKNSGKNIASKDHHSIPTGLRKAKTFLEDEYLEEICCLDDQRYFYVKAKCCHSYRKNDPPHILKIALCIISVEVEFAHCTGVAGNVGYCNHVLALMFKLCKFTVFFCKSTEDLNDESDQQATLACTSTLQQWYKKGGGLNIRPEAVMEVVINRTKLDEERARPGVKSLLYEARLKVNHSKNAEKNLRKELAQIDPNMGFAQMMEDEEPVSTVDTKFGKCQVGSYLSYQVTFTEANFKATADIDCIPRLLVPNELGELTFPRFRLRNLSADQMVLRPNLSNDEMSLIEKLQISEDEINKIEIGTRKQSECDEWKSERKFRFTASLFHLISKRQKNHDTFADTLMNPKPVFSRYTEHGKKFESVALLQYHKFMHNRKTPVQVLPSGFVVSHEFPILGATPDVRVVDPGCTEHYGLAEVKCPQRKFHVTPMDASSDPAFYMEKISDTQCVLKKSDKYYAQVQGQMGVTGAKWCDFILYTNVGLYVQKIPFDVQFWNQLRDKLTSYYFNHFIKFAAAELAKESLG